ncbi:hypothetical protein E1301_Tti004686 [Triplophysa tibetana]|uniref:Secreted protein n=1 Tax=Triplophysa tibetana TaxID=1572043 RepID=A0A5A9N991_9TELE|nr:hypothetical protein E1301_Tti004686 [Triplophysa tibetana]
MWFARWALGCIYQALLVEMTSTFQLVLCVQTATHPKSTCYPMAPAVIRLSVCPVISSHGVNHPVHLSHASDSGSFPDGIKAGEERDRKSYDSIPCVYVYHVRISRSLLKKRAPDNQEPKPHRLHKAPGRTCTSSIPHVYTLQLITHFNCK